MRLCGRKNNSKPKREDEKYFPSRAERFVVGRKISKLRLKSLLGFNDFPIILYSNFVIDGSVQLAD